MRRHPCYSSLTTYERCPAAFRVLYVDGDPGVCPEAMNNGRLVHDGIARYAEHCYKASVRLDADAGLRIAAGYPADVRELLEHFVESWRWEWGAVVSEGSVPVEQHLFGTLPGGERFSGHIDLLQRYEGGGTVEADPFGENDSDENDGCLWTIIDWKSGLYGDFDATHPPRQLLWYAWLVQQNYPGARTFELSLHVLRAGAWQPNPWRVGGDLSFVGVELQSLCDRIAADSEYEPNPGAVCAGCTAIHACPCRDAETLDRIVCSDTDDHAEGWLREVLWHDAQSAALTALLKPYAKEHGRVLVPGAVYEGRAGESLVVKNPVTLEADLKPFGLVPGDLTNGPTKANIEKRARALEEEKRPAFEALFETRAGNLTYKAYKE